MSKYRVAASLVSAAAILAVTGFAAGATPDGSKRGEARLAASALSAVPAPILRTTPVAVAAPELRPTPIATSEPACARKVKVIYQGYGEADRASCATSVVVTR